MNQTVDSKMTFYSAFIGAIKYTLWVHYRPLTFYTGTTLHKLGLCVSQTSIPHLTILMPCILMSFIVLSKEEQLDPSKIIKVTGLLTLLFLFEI